MLGCFNPILRHILTNPNLGLKNVIKKNVTQWLGLPIFDPVLEHSKNAGLFQPKFGSNMDKSKCWVKNAIKNTVESES